MQAIKENKTIKFDLYKSKYVGTVSREAKMHIIKENICIYRFMSWLQYFGD